MGEKTKVGHTQYKVGSALFNIHSGKRGDKLVVNGQQTGEAWKDYKNFGEENKIDGEKKGGDKVGVKRERESGSESEKDDAERGKKKRKYSL